MANEEREDDKALNERIAEEARKARARYNERSTGEGSADECWSEAVRTLVEQLDNLERREAILVESRDRMAAERDTLRIRESEARERAATAERDAAAARAASDNHCAGLINARAEMARLATTVDTLAMRLAAALTD